MCIVKYVFSFVCIKIVYSEMYIDDWEVCRQRKGYDIVQEHIEANRERATMICTW